jgi:predicted HTH transcriptional regulator
MKGRNHTLMSPEAITWLNQFAGVPLNDRQRLALVFLRQREHITNADYRRLNHMDRIRAGQELRELVQTGLVEQHSAGRWTHYSLEVPGELRVPEMPGTEEDKILNFVRENGSINNAKCRELLGVKEERAWYLLLKLCRANLLSPEGKGRWRRYVAI